MQNISIVINKATRMIQSISKNIIGNEGENLQENLVFSFDDEFVDGQARLELKFVDSKSWITLTKTNETYEIPVKSIMTKTGKVYMQLVVDEGTDATSVPIFKSNTFYVIVNSSINAVDEAPEGYAQWIEIANAKLNQMDNLDIDVEKVDHTATITITKKDETQEIVNVYDGQDGADGQDGVGLNYNWSGTSLGVKREDESNYDYVNLQGPVGPAGSIRMEIVNTLPDVGQEGTLYFVPKTPDTSDLYDEYVWVNNAWELLGEKQIVVDLSNYYTKQETYSQAEVNALIPSLTDYVKNTDYATNSKGGVIKVGSSYATSLSAGGFLRADNKTYSQYIDGADILFVGKGTLENVITGKGLVSNTDYASQNTAGVFKTLATYGTAITNDGYLYGATRTYAQYTSGNDALIISKGTLENVLTARIGDIDSVLDAINGEII